MANFPIELWKAIDQDAKRCRRSSIKQVEAILLSYYGIENVDLDREMLSRMHDTRTKEAETVSKKS